MSLAVFVNSCDSFEDCWIPFFRLFEIYGSALRALPLYLNTERAQFQHNRLDVRSTRVWAENEKTRPSWSECLRRGIDAVNEDYILYLQEDYFLTRCVRFEIVEEALRAFKEAPGTGVIYLSRQGPRVQKSRAFAGSFFEVLPPARYLIDTQAAIWNKEYLWSLVRPWENAWMFEKFASLRERATPSRILKVTPEALDAGEVIHYVWSGVMKGKWKPECVNLFRTHGIAINFKQRGFYREGSLLKYRLEVLHKLFGRPVPALRSILSLLQKTPTR
jgi:hypothetical protein